MLSLMHRFVGVSCSDHAAVMTKPEHCVAPEDFTKDIFGPEILFAKII